MPGLYTGASGLWGGFAGLLYGSTSLSTPPGLLADAAGFSPSSLFANGEQGVWYQNSDFSTLFQGAAGTTPVTALEQPVGLRLDKSKGGVGTNGTKRVNLVSWSEAFDNAAWSKAGCTVVPNDALAPDGTLTADKIIFSAANQEIYQRVTVIGSHKISAYIKGTVGETISISNGGVAPAVGFNHVLTGGWDFVELTSTATNDYWSISTYAGATARTIWLWGADLRLTSEASTAPTPYQRITDTWYNTIPGNHAFQTTNSARPVLSARYNLLTRTEEFDNAYWSKDGATVTADQTTAPNSTNTADLLVETATTGVHGLYRVPSGAFAAGSYLFSCYMKQGSSRYASLFLNTVAGASIATVDLQDGVITKSDVVGTGVTAPVSPTITPAANDFYLVTISATTTAAINALGPLLSNSATPTYSATAPAAYAGNTANNIYIWGADLRAASESPALPPYQRVGAATYGSSTSVGNPDYDTVGFPPYLIYDGGDWYQTNSIDFSAGATNPPLGPELVTNGGPFTVTTGWTGNGATLSVVSGALRFTTTSAYGGGYASFPTVAGAYYKFTFSLPSTARGRFGTNQSNADLFAAAGGTVSGVFRATSTTSFFSVFDNTGVTVSTFDLASITVKELTDSNYAPDKMSVFAGVRKLSDANTSVVVESSTNYFFSNGSFILTAPPSNGVSQYGLGARGDSAGYGALESFAAPVTNIVTELIDISGSALSSELRGRVNSLDVTLSGATGLLGVGNFGNYPLYIGSRSGSDLFLRGRDYGFVIVGRAVTASELTNTEDYMDVQTFGKNMTLVYSDELTTATGDLITAADGDQIYMSVSYV